MQSHACSGMGREMPHSWTWANRCTHRWAEGDRAMVSPCIKVTLKSHTLEIIGIIFRLGFPLLNPIKPVPISLHSNFTEFKCSPQVKHYN